MRKIFFIQLLLLISLLAVGAGTELYYIVDGKPGVPVDQLPPAEEIASQREIEPQEAEYIYGDCAVNGAVIVKTKEYARQEQLQLEQDQLEYQQKLAAEEQERAEQEALAIQQQEDQKMRFIILWMETIVLALVLFWLLKKSKASFEEACRIAQEKTPGHVAKSERFNVTGSSKFTIMILVLVVFIIVYAPLVWLCFTSDRASVMYAVLALSAEFLILYLLIESMVYLRQCYIIVDDEGIRGVCAENSLLLTYKGMDIRWEQVASAEVVKESSGRTKVERLVLYGDEEHQKKVGSFLLMVFPASEVTAQVNRFYARFSGKQLMK